MILLPYFLKIFSINLYWAPCQRPMMCSPLPTSITERSIRYQVPEKQFRFENVPKLRPLFEKYPNDKPEEFFIHGILLEDIGFCSCSCFLRSWRKRLQWNRSNVSKDKGSSGALCGWSACDQNALLLLLLLLLTPSTLLNLRRGFCGQGKGYRWDFKPEFLQFRLGKLQSESF